MSPFKRKLYILWPECACKEKKKKLIKKKCKNGTSGQCKQHSILSETKGKGIKPTFITSLLIDAEC